MCLISLLHRETDIKQNMLLQRGAIGISMGVGGAGWCVSKSIHNGQRPFRKPVPPL